jgi:hypothetical protein
LTVTPGDLNHFVFSTVGSQVAGTSFSGTITAEDSQGNTVTDYSGSVSLSYSAGSISPTITGGFTDGVWTGSVTVTAAGVSVTLGVNDGSGHTGESNLFDVNSAIAASAGSHGSITPFGAVIVSYGADQTFTITPDEHYHVADVLVDGVSVGAVTSYAFYNVTGDNTISASFAIDTFTVTVASAHGSPTVSALVNAGDSFNASVTSPESAGTGHQWICTGYSIDGEPVVSGTNYLFTNVQSNHTITFSWTEQYYLTVSGNFGSVSPVSGWYDSGSIVDISASATNSSGERFLWNGWAGTGNISYTGLTNEISVTMNSAVSEAAFWTLQYYLIVTSVYGMTSGAAGYPAGSLDYAGLSTGMVSGASTQYLFTGFSGDVSGISFSSSKAITMKDLKRQLQTGKLSAR